MGAFVPGEQRDGEVRLRTHRTKGPEDVQYDRGQLSLAFGTVPATTLDTMTNRSRNLATHQLNHPTEADLTGAGSRARSQRGGVTPPTSKSLAADGALKDTPANRALIPRADPSSLFSAPDLTRAAFHADATSLVFHGDVRGVLRDIAKTGLKVDCIVTSPPFYGQRDYGVRGQLGLETHPQEYLDRLLEVFALCRDVLSDKGSLWVNLGDTFWSGKGAHKSKEKKQPARRFGARPQDGPGDGRWARPKQLLLLPHRFAIAMQDAGWLVRNDNVWVKPSPVPDQVRDRCSISHEYVFHFTKERWYYFDQGHVARSMPNGTALPPLDTWVVPTARGNGSHRASFSEELVRIPILATTPPDGIVLDPFNGSGTSMVFAKRHGFRAVGIDLSRDYCEQCVASLMETTPLKGV